MRAVAPAPLEAGLSSPPSWAGRTSWPPPAPFAKAVAAAGRGWWLGSSVPVSHSPPEGPHVTSSLGTAQGILVSSPFSTPHHFLAHTELPPRLGRWTRSNAMPQLGALLTRGRCGSPSAERKHNPGGGAGRCTRGGDGSMDALGVSESAQAESLPPFSRERLPYGSTSWQKVQPRTRSCSAERGTLTRGTAAMV